MALEELVPVLGDELVDAELFPAPDPVDDDVVPLASGDSDGEDLSPQAAAVAAISPSDARRPRIEPCRLSMARHAAIAGPARNRQRTGVRTSEPGGGPRANRIAGRHTPAPRRLRSFEAAGRQQEELLATIEAEAFIWNSDRDRFSDPQARPKVKSMRVGIQGWGSEGDLRPLIALAARLRREGHAPSLVLTPIDSRDYREQCRALDVPLVVAPEEIAFSLDALVEGARSADPLKLSRAVLDLGFTPHLESMYAAAVDLCERSDVVIGGSSSWYVKAAALKVGIPFVAVDYYPGVVPSKRVPPLGLPSWGPLNGLRWAVLHFVFDLAFKKPAAKFFAEKRLPPPRHAIPDVIFSERLNLHAASPTLCPPAPDWSELHPVCGEFFLPDDLEPWAPSPALRAFLDGGPPPLLISLGSMEHMAPGRARDLMIKAVREAKLRAILQSKRSAAEGRDGDLYFLPWAPHRRLIAECSVGVHHGGAGTTHAVLRAGRPSVVIPFIFEQRLWANRLAQVGVAPRAVSFWKATPSKVARQLRTAVESDEMHARARQLAGAMAAEDGTGRAVRLLEELVSPR